MLASLFDSQPELLAIVIAILGIVAAGLLARLTERGIMRFESYMMRNDPARLEQLDLQALQRSLRVFVYYGTLVVFLLMALHTLHISVVREWLGMLIQYIPQLILGGLIILSGYLVSVVCRSLVAGLMEVKSDHLVPRFTQVLIVTAAVLTGLEQTAIDISFISSVIVIFLSLVFGGLALAFAIGSRQLMENLLARRALDRYRIGDHVRVNGIQGKIVEILSTAVIIESPEGVTTIPTARFADADVLTLNEGDPGGDES